MKKQHLTRKLQLAKDTLVKLEKIQLEQAAGEAPTTTVQTRWRTCTC